MKIWTKRLNYRKQVLLSSGKWIAPAFVYVAVVYTLYSTKPQEYISDAIVSALILSYIMLWISFSYLYSEDLVSEQVLYCNLNRDKTKYYGSKIIFLYLIAFLMSLLGAIYPILQHVINGFSLFQRNVVFSDFIGSLMLHLLLSSVFISIAYLLQPRIMRERNVATFLMIMIAVISLCKNEIIADFPISKYILFVFLPVCSISKYFKGIDYFTIQPFIKAFLYSMLYSLITFFVGQIITNRKDF